MPSEPIAATLLVIDALERLGVPYLIGGSLASAVHGVARATLDADVVTDLQPEHAAFSTSPPPAPQRGVPRSPFGTSPDSPD